MAADRIPYQGEPFGKVKYWETVVMMVNFLTGRSAGKKEIF